ncbi:uncharacterized protein LOC143257391 isoform X3 [Tachypleus tridentatus]|uniref:uncharacterized protein LOC143257391 isoform X3 n=1 Tax=Tachypleus tridentatus TaxID=6853 RepID=UPI003FCFE25B
MLISKFCPVAALLLMFLHSLSKVSCQDVSKSPGKHLNDLTHVNIPQVTDVTNGFSRFHKLYHECTKRHVQIRPLKKKKRKKKPKRKCGRFKATGRSGDNFSVFLVIKNYFTSAIIREVNASLRIKNFQGENRFHHTGESNKPLLVFQ